MGFGERFAPSVLLGVSVGIFGWLIGKCLEVISTTVPTNTAEALLILLWTAIAAIGLIRDRKASANTPRTTEG